MTPMLALVDVYDRAWGRNVRMTYKDADRMTGLYPDRFVKRYDPRHPELYQQPKLLIRVKEKTMPQLPQTMIALQNGTHVLTSVSVETVAGTYGEQECVTCAVQGQNEMTRIWIPHNSRKRIDAAVAVGLVKIDENNEEWNVVIGCVFCAVAAGGKIVALLPYEKKV